MTPAPAAAVPPQSEAARARLRRVIIKIFAVQIVTMLGLWALSVAFGAQAGPP